MSAAVGREPNSESVEPPFSAGEVEDEGLRTALADRSMSPWPPPRAWPWETPRLRPCNCEGDDAAKNELPKVALVPPPLPPPLCPLTASPKRLAKGPDLDLVMAPCAMSAVNVPVPPAPVPPPAALKSELVRDENEERDERAGWPTPTALLLLLPPLPPPPPPAPAVRSSRSWSSESRAMASPRYSPCPSWCCGTEEASGSPRPTRPTPPPNEAPRTELPVPRGAKLRALAT